MAKKKTNKSFIIGLIFFIVWVFLYGFLVIAFQNGSGQATQQFLSSHLKVFLAYMLFEQMASLGVLFTILIYVIFLFMILIMLLWIIFAVKSKNGRKVLGFLIAWIFIIPGLEMVGTFYPFEKDGFLHYTTYLGFLTNEGMGVAMKIFAVATLLFAFLSMLFGIIFGIKGIAKFAKKKEEATEEALVEEERASIEEVVTEREAEEERLEETRAEREREEEALRAAVDERELLSDRLRIDELKELIRQVVREELDRRGNPAPQIIQNFYGVRGQQPIVQEEPQEEEKVEEVASETIAEEAAVEQVQEEVEEPKEKKPIIRIPFQQRMLDADQEMKDNYSELKNELLSWGLKSRISSSGDSFRLHCKTYCKITIAGKSLKLYLALDPNDYADSTLPIQNAGEKNIYQEIPLVFKVRSGLSMRRAKTLIRDACEKDNLEQGAIGNENWAEVLKNEYVEKDEAAEEAED